MQWCNPHLVMILKIRDLMHYQTRPDTRPIPVADGWAGAEMHVFTLFDLCSRTDGRIDGRTNRRTVKASFRVSRKEIIPPPKKNKQNKTKLNKTKQRRTKTGR